MTDILLYLTLGFVAIGLAFWFTCLFRKQKEIATLKEENQVMRDVINSKNDSVERAKDGLQENYELLLGEMNSAYGNTLSLQKSHNENIETAKLVQKLNFINKYKIQDYFKNSIVYLKPKDIVSGDFYWTKYFDNRLYIVLGDSTGHGVVGAFMSLFGLSIVKEELDTVHLLTKPPAAHFLTKIRKNLLEKYRELDNHKVFEHKFDMSFCILDIVNSTVQFAGANTSIIHIKNSVLKEYKGEKLPIGIYIKDKEYKNHEFELKDNDLLYLYSDGYASFDENNRKFTKNRFKQLLLDMSSKEMSEQKTMLDKQFDLFGYNQLDDFLLIGIKANSSEKEEHNKVKNFVSKGIIPDPEMGSKFNSIQKIVINNPLYEFTGNLNLQGIKSILEDFERLTENIGSNRFKKKSYVVLVDILQNTFGYPGKNSDIKLLINISENNLYYLSEYKINIDELESLKKDIGYLNVLNKNELKEYYKSILKNAVLGTKIRGIGLIDIARKSNNKILYKFTKIDDKSTLVSLITTIDIK